MSQRQHQSIILPFLTICRHFSFFPYWLAIQISDAMQHDATKWGWLLHLQYSLFANLQIIIIMITNTNTTTIKDRHPPDSLPATVHRKTTAVQGHSALRAARNG